MEVLKSISNYAAYLVLPITLFGCVEENVAPEAENDSATLSQGESVIVKVLDNDTDDNDDPLEVTNLSTPEHGRITVQSDGSVLYQHDGTATTEDAFTYTAFDGAAESQAAVVSIAIKLNENGSEDDSGSDSNEDNSPPTSDNQRPVARDDQIQITQGESQSLNLTQNDVDPDGDPLQIVTLTNPLRGRVELQADGVTVVYRHDGSDSTEDRFSYIVSDGKLQSQTAQVSITVAPSNSAPKFTRSGSNTSIPVDVLYSLTFQASDPDGDEISYSVEGLPYWLVHTPLSRTLSGAPSWEDLGRNYTIIISASDGKTSTENRFTISVSEAQSVTDSMAHRLLQQSTFGPVESEMARVKSLGISGWVDAQLSMNSAYTSASDGWKTHLERTQEIAQQAEPSVQWFGSGQAFNQSTSSSTVRDYQMAAWWESALTATAPQRTQIGTDQLRQRVAYALSQLLVVSTSSHTLSMRGEALAAYYDLLAEHAFGNYRDLLGEVAISPAMGAYLSHQGNSKADLSTGSRPDENFAREIIQLFTIGLYELNLDGSPDQDGNSSSFPDAGTGTVPTYTQTDIEELAKVMTGWDLAENSRFGRLSTKSGDYTQPMVFHPSEHEDESAEGGDGDITLLGTTFPLNSGQDGSGLDKALDTLFAHPNVAPYVSKHLIQRLVTSNPTSNYIARVARIFNDNGQGVKGDLKAVVRAILLDPEARDDSYRTNPAFGKAKEPLLAITQLLRAAHVTPLNGWKSRDNVSMDHVYWFRNPESYLNQGAMRSPSVFNFYNPHHVPSDDYFTTHQLVGPEFQIQTSQTLADYNNLFFQLVSSFENNKITDVNGKSLSEFSATRGQYALSLLTNFDTELSLFEQTLENDSNGDFSSLSDNTPDNNGETPKARAVDALIDHFDLVMLGSSMSDNYRAALKHYLLSNSYTNTGNNRENVRRMIQDAFTLIATSSDYMIQK
ncbi:MAG: DUF1800 family protein [Candidatus Thiodiazotropha sp. 6PLUC5]